MGVGIGLNIQSIKKDLLKVVSLIALGLLPFLLAEYLSFLQNSSLDKHINPITLGWLILGSVVAILFLFLARKQKKYLAFFIFLILLIFVFLKQPQLSTWLSRNMRFLFQQNTNTASSLDIRWFGYSYIAFRIIHVIREYQKGRFSQVPYFVFSTFVYSSRHYLLDRSRNTMIFQPNGKLSKPVMWRMTFFKVLYDYSSDCSRNLWWQMRLL